MKCDNYAMPIYDDLSPLNLACGSCNRNLSEAAYPKDYEVDERGNVECSVCRSVFCADCGQPLIGLFITDRKEGESPRAYCYGCWEKKHPRE